MAGKDKFQVGLDYSSLREIDAFKLGFLQASDKRKFNSLLGRATLNAARTMVKPVRAAAPKRTGRLRAAVAARPARFNRPAAVVGIRAGKSRQDPRGAWYRWFVVSGHDATGRAKTQQQPKPTGWAAIAAGQVPQRSAGGRTPRRVPANDFVRDTTTKPDVQARAVDTIAKTISAYFAGEFKLRVGRGKK